MPRGTGFPRFPRVFFELVTPFSSTRGVLNPRAPGRKLPDKLSKIIRSIVLPRSESYVEMSRTCRNFIVPARSSFLGPGPSWFCLWRARDRRGLFFELRIPVRNETADGIYTPVKTLQILTRISRISNFAPLQSDGFNAYRIRPHESLSESSE